MRRIFVLWMMLVYAVLSLGIRADYHYCGGELMEVAFWEQAGCGACMPEEEGEDGCCAHEQIAYQLEESRCEHTGEDIVWAALLPAVQPVVSAHVWPPVPVYVQQCMALPEAPQPPDIPLFLRYGVWII